ncbi:MAG: DNA primase [Bacilli bacterium]|nr:DNA primase [Bacilli bacterium]
MELISEHKLNEIRKSVDIVDVISEYVSLSPHGKNYFGICPFHNDKNPSMSVSKEKQIYKCFSCGESGNVFNFVQKYENISFIEAVKIIAEKANINIDISVKDKQVNKLQVLYDIYGFSLKLYQNNINTKQGLEAKKYLNDRSIDDKLIKDFEIGLSLKDYKMLINLLVNKKYSYEDIMRTGLVVKNDYGYSDIYYNRIMFPLCDLSGKVIGYSGRIYNEKSDSKYINTRETELFKKGELLYNYHRAKDSARKEDAVIILEGFMDVIRCHSVKITNTIALMGTAMTKYQANLIKRMAKNVIICFDGDAAGEKATESASKELINVGVIPKIVRLEEGLDPDEYILKYGEGRFRQKLDNPLTVTEFKLSYYKKGKNLNSVEDKANYLNEVIRSLNEIDDDILREVTINKISEESNIDSNLLRRKLAKKEIIVEEHPNVIKFNKYQKAEMYLLYYMVNSKEVIKLYEHKAGYLPTLKFRLLSRAVLKFYKDNNDINIADLMSCLDDELNGYLKEIIDLDLKDEYTLEEINDYINTINEYNLNYEIKRLREELKTCDLEKQKEILQKIVELKGDSND